jgi:hypothetical protein
MRKSVNKNGGGNTYLIDRPLKAIQAFDGEVNAWFNINSFEKKAHLQKIDEEGMLNSVDSGTPLLFYKRSLLYYETDTI